MVIGGRAHTVEEVELVAKAGLAFAEISITDSDHFFGHQLEDLLRLKEKYGIYYLGHGPEEGNAWQPSILRKELLPRIVSLFDCLAELSINIFTIHFWIDRRFISERVLEDKLEILAEMASYANEKGIKLCIENLSERFSDFSSAFDRIDSLGMTLDIGHAELLTDINNSYDFSRNCSERIYHAHVHDNRGGITPEDDLHLAIGDGVIDFESILGNLKKKGFDRTITLEVKPYKLIEGKKNIDKIWNG